MTMRNETLLQKWERERGTQCQHCDQIVLYPEIEKDRVGYDDECRVVVHYGCPFCENVMAAVDKLVDGAKANGT